MIFRINRRLRRRKTLWGWFSSWNDPVVPDPRDQAKNYVRKMIFRVVGVRLGVVYVHVWVWYCARLGVVCVLQV